MHDTATEFEQAWRAKELSASALAARIGVTRKTVYNWKTGKTKPGKSHRLLLAATFLVHEEVVNGWFKAA